MSLYYDKLNENQFENFHSGMCDDIICWDGANIAIGLTSSSQYTFEKNFNSYK